MTRQFVATPYELVRAFLTAPGDINDEDLTEGFRIADEEGWDTLDELGEITLSYILFGTDYLEDRVRCGWASVDWSIWEREING